MEYYTRPMIGRVLVYYKIHSKNNLSKVVKWGGGPSLTCSGGVVIGSGEGSAGVVGLSSTSGGSRGTCDRSRITDSRYGS